MILNYTDLQVIRENNPKKKIALFKGCDSGSCTVDIF